MQQRPKLHLRLGGLQQTVKLGSEHDVALCLELASHEGFLAIKLSLCQLGQGVITEDDGDVCFGLCWSEVDSAGLLHVERPYLLSAGLVLHLHLEDTICLFDLLLLLLLAEFANGLFDTTKDF